LLDFLLDFLEGVAVMAARKEEGRGLKTSEKRVRDLRRLPPHQ